MTEQHHKEDENRPPQGFLDFIGLNPWLTIILAFFFCVMIESICKAVLKVLN